MAGASRVRCGEARGPALPGSRRRRRAPAARLLPRYDARDQSARLPPPPPFGLALMAATETVEGRTATGVKEGRSRGCMQMQQPHPQQRKGSGRRAGRTTRGRDGTGGGRAINGADDRRPAFTTTSLSGLGACTPLVCLRFAVSSSHACLRTHNSRTGSSTPMGNGHCTDGGVYMVSC